MKREQSRAGSRFAECEKSRLKAKILITLALLLTAVTGAWAQDVTWNVSDISTAVDGNMGENESYTSDGITMKYVKIEGNDGCTIGQNIEIWGGSGVLEFTAPEGMKFAKIVINGSGNQAFGYWNKVKYGDGYWDGVYSLTWEDEPAEVVTTSSTADGWDLGVYNASTIEFYFASDPIEVTPVEGQANKWSFAMPGSDVVLTPQYAPAAQLDEDGAPAPVSGLEIAADAAIITAGQSAQGTLLYAVGTSATEKPALTAFAATLPNAKDQTAAGTYYVWYYIQGQDTPQGQEPSADNTFNDSEIMGPLTVELLTNEHTLNIKQSSNITVTVDGTAVTPTDDKVTPVTTGQEVKIKAKEGYKFRKVEVKKAGAKAPTTAQLNVPTGWNGDNTNVTANDLPGFVALTDEEAANIPCPDAEGYVYVIHSVPSDGYIRIIAFYNGERQGQQSYTLARYHDEIYYDVNDNQIKYYYTTGK